MRFKYYVSLVFLITLTLQGPLAQPLADRSGSYDKNGYPMDTVAMNHVTGEEFSHVKGEVDKALATIRTCKALQPQLLANLVKAEKAFAAYNAAMQSLYYPTEDSRSGTIHASQSTYLDTRMLNQYLELLTPVFKGSQRAEWCGKE